MTKTTRVPGRFVGPGGVRQHGGTLALYRCNTCGDDVVWAESRRTGQKYLANVSGNSATGSRYYIAASLHDCGKRQDEYRERMLEETRKEIMALFMREGKCVDPGPGVGGFCGEEGAWDTRLNERWHICPDCLLKRMEAQAQS
jgi:hypothetical protein